jgi:hypothetical protein
MPRTPRSGLTNSQTAGGRRRRRSTANPIVEQISQLVAENQALQREAASLRSDNERLRGQLDEIGSALGRLSGGRRGRGRSTAATTAPAAPPRKRKPITDPEVLEKRRQALVRARSARAERLAAARAATAQAASSSP